MATQVIYITEDYLKKNTNLSNNIDSMLLRPTIIKAQDLYITPFLGTILDGQLKNHIITNSITTQEQELLTLIKKSQVEFTCYLAYVDIMFRWMNKSAANPTIENGVNISKSDMAYIRDIAKNQGEFYLEQAKKYLDDNKSYFTMWNCDNKQAFKYPFDYDDCKG